MTISQSFLRSLLLTSALSFSTPVLLIGVVLFGLTIIGQISLVGEVAQLVVRQIVQVLSVFGSGDAVQGTLVIGLTCGLVGGMFDTYAFYRHNLRRN